MKMRFSIKTILASTFVIAVALTIILLVTKDYRERMALRAQLLSMGADFVHVNPDRSIRLFFAHPIESSAFAKFEEIESLELKGFHLDSDSLGNLAKLKHIDVLLIQTCTIENPDVLATLSQIGSIDSLLIWNTPIKDDAIDAITQIPGIQIVDLSNTQVTQSGVDRLRAALPDATIRVRP